MHGPPDTEALTSLSFCQSNLQQCCQANPLKTQIWLCSFPTKRTNKQKQTSEQKQRISGGHGITTMPLCLRTWTSIWRPKFISPFPSLQSPAPAQVPLLPGAAFLSSSLWRFALLPHPSACSPPGSPFRTGTNVSSTGSFLPPLQAELMSSLHFHNPLCTMLLSY